MFRGHNYGFPDPSALARQALPKVPAGEISTEKKRYERSHQNRCADYWRGAVRTVCCFRTGPVGYEGASGRYSRQDWRAVCRALSGKADLRHSGYPIRHWSGRDGCVDGADQALQADLPSQRDGGEHREDRRSRLSRHYRRRQDIRMQGGRDLRRWRIIPAEAAAGARDRGLRGAFCILFRAQDGAVPRQGFADCWRRRFRAGLDAQSAPDRQARHAVASARRFPRRAP